VGTPVRISDPTSRYPYDTTGADVSDIERPTAVSSLSDGAQDAKAFLLVAIMRSRNAMSSRAGILIGNYSGCRAMEER
jgi:hypothetical protein